MSESRDRQAGQLPAFFHRNATWMLVLGIILVLGGFAALVSPFLASLYVLFLIGFTFLFAGVAQVIQAFSKEGFKGSLLHVLAGLLYVIGGLLILFKPLAGLLAVALIVVATFIAGGVVRLVAGLQLRPEKGWGWITVGGMASIVAGLVIWANLPDSAAIILGIIAGVSFITEGWAMIALSSAARRIGKG